MHLQGCTKSQHSQPLSWDRSSILFPVLSQQLHLIQHQASLWHCTLGRSMAFVLRDIKDVCGLRAFSFVHGIIPVGSKGISHEAMILTKESNLSLTLASSHIDLEKSAGPSTVLLCAIPSRCLNHVKRVVNGKSTSTIGYFHSR